MAKTKTYRFSQASVDIHFHAKFSELGKLTEKARTVLVTDENIYQSHLRLFKGWNCIVLKPGEAFKVQPTVDSIIGQLIAMEADRGWTIVGVGGGVVTDITGYVAAVYMRGIRFGFVPTTLLAMVDASIGGKNGIDVGPYKNLVGTIRQPAFLLYDMAFLKTLPPLEWINGYAEIIKHACIRDKAAFKFLEATTPEKLRKKPAELSALVERNVKLKCGIVQDDEFETGDRKLLNFGHTLGHAFETQYQLSHGQAVSIGMTCASLLSEDILGFRDHAALLRLLGQYGLPSFLHFDAARVMEVLKMDKKRAGRDMQFILLEKIGKAVVRKIPLTELEGRVQQMASK